MTQRPLLIAVAVLALMFAFFLSDGLNRAGLTGSGGFITSGEKFGLEIGSAVGQADQQLTRRGFVSVEQVQDGSCLSRTYSEVESAELWMHRGWPRATVCVIERDGRVSAIGWSVGGWEF